jgi:hypothetical protein
MNNFIKNRQLRIFISSTFRDMQAERDYLIQNTFPSLRKYCAERDVLLQEIDLRWGITEEESKQGKVVDTCLKEIKNTYPFFIGLLGERYGWVPDEQEQENIKSTGIFEDKEFAWVQSKLREGTSITEIEIQNGVLRAEGKVHAYFYFRSPTMEVPDDFKEQAGSEGAIKLESLKKTIREQKKYPVKEYESVIKLGELVERDIKYLVDTQFPKFFKNEYHKEQYEQMAFLKSRTVVYIPVTELDKELDLFAESEARGLMITGDSGMGKSALLANWIQKRENRGGEKTVYHFISQSRSSENYIKIMLWLQKEIWRVCGFLKSNPDGAWLVIGVSLGLIPVIGGIVAGRWFIVIGLIAGIITSLLGMVSAMGHGWGLLSLTFISGSIVLGIHMRHPFIFGLVGVIVGIVFWGIGYGKYQWPRYKAAKDRAEKMSWNDKNAKEDLGAFNLQESLLAAQRLGRLIIVLDGLDKLSDDNAKLLNWLPVLPENTKLVLSTVKNPAATEHFRNMNYQIIEMPALDAENRKTLIKNYLAQYGKSLTENQIKKLACDKKNENPLALITILDELRMFGKFEELDVEIDRYLNVENIPDLFKLVLERLEKSNTGKKEFVRDVFSLLYVSQEGLYENEILKITGNRPLCWSQLFNGTANHLIIRGGRVTFAHNFIREAAKIRYLPQKTEEKQFRDKIVRLMKSDAVSDNRKYDELSRQYFELENWDDLYNLLLNFSVTDYLLQNNEDYFSQYWRALLDIDKQKYDIENYLGLDAQGRNTKEVSAFFIKMSLFAAESLFDSSVSVKFTRKSMELTDENYAKQNVS